MHCLVPLQLRDQKSTVFASCKHRSNAIIQENSETKHWYKLFVKKCQVFGERQWCALLEENLQQCLTHVDGVLNIKQRQHSKTIGIVCPQPRFYQLSNACLTHWLCTVERFHDDNLDKRLQTVSKTPHLCPSLAPVSSCVHYWQIASSQHGQAECQSQCQQ